MQKASRTEPTHPSLLLLFAGSFFEKEIMVY